MNRNKIIKIITKQFPTWQKDPDPNITVHIKEFEETYPMSNDVIRLKFTVIGPEETLWAGKEYNGYLQYGSGYPMSPPDLFFTTPILHPNVYVRSDIWGKLCISILHEGIDPFGFEDINSRWTPAHNIGTILRSMYTLFYDPACDSPANIDASNLYMHNKEELSRQIQAI
jgi:ubiquitin-protein ligase